MKKGLSTVAAMFLSGFFILIVLVLMLAVMEIQDAEQGAMAFVFASVDFLAVLIMVGLGKFISGSVGVGMYAPMVMTTVFYVIVSLIFNCAASDMDSTAAFVLINLVMMFIYFCVVIPMAVTGSNHKEEPDQNPNKTNNIDNQYYNIRR